MELSVRTRGQGRGDVSTRAAEALSGTHGVCIPQAHGLADPSATRPSPLSAVARAARRLGNGCGGPGSLGTDRCSLPFSLCHGQVLSDRDVALPSEWGRRQQGTALLAPRRARPREGARPRAPTGDVSTAPPPPSTAVAAQAP